MLKDKFMNSQTPEQDAISVPMDHEIIQVLTFVDNNIGNFFSYYATIKDSDSEDRTSDYLISHFQICNYEQSEGFFPYYFGKHPTQEHSDRETDIGVFPLARKQRLVPIIEFEAKRLSESSNNKEYVAGERGGIERFKRAYHAPYASICGMFGYVQSRTPEHWIQKINGWIDELAKTNQDATIDWSDGNEKLMKINSFLHGEKYISNNTRKEKYGNKNICIWHYFIDLVL
jgi:hypothetical protein